MKSEPVDDAVLWREALCVDGTLNGLLSVSNGLCFGGTCWGAACGGAGWEECVRGAAWKCSGRRWPGLGLLKRWACSPLALSCFSGFLSGLVSPNCGAGALSSRTGSGAAAGASLCGGCSAGGSRSRTMAEGRVLR
jgi:hypothetical protein